MCKLIQKVALERATELLLDKPLGTDGGRWQSLLVEMS